jgi:hypothetical protein
LTKYGSHVSVLVRRDELRASKIMAKRLLSHPKVVRGTFIQSAAFVEPQADGYVQYRGLGGEGRGWVAECGPHQEREDGRRK